MSVVSSFASAALTLRCNLSASPTWSPIVCKGDRELIGSWKMIEIRPPRIARIAAPSAGNWTRSTTSPLPRGSANRIAPRTIRPLRQDAQDALADDRFPRAAFADQRHGRCRTDAEIDALDRVERSAAGREADVQILNAEQVVHRAAPLSA